MILSRLRYPLHELRGRRYPEPPHPYRNEFQRDRDRIIHARAFRRLEDKTQVFSERLSDHFRNRLTHTIEVAQIARTVAAALGLDEDFTEALALAHDIGHPPFGHAGEEALDAQMRRYGDRFDHNVNALRLVESFEQRYAGFPGLNLTFEVREGIVKHSRDFEPGEHPELDEFLPGLRPPLEAQLIDLADEVAYNTADLDDGWSAGLFTMEEIEEAVPGFAEIAARTRKLFPHASGRAVFLESQRRLIDFLATALIEGTAAKARASGAETAGDVRRMPRLAGMTPPAAETNRALKQFLFAHLYSIPMLAEERRAAMEQIAALFQFFMEHSEELPENHQKRLDDFPLYRVVCDYIAGMTDGYFRRTVRRLLL
ncbi:MAG: deoxyguanosinetriphosphate triphosphohydrolase [Acidobacteriota bacterium]